jgi:hypothetical protein
VTNNFKLTLDTTAPIVLSATIDGGAPITSLSDLTIDTVLEDADTTGYQMKVWGDVDPEFDPNVQLTEEESTWVAFDPSFVAQASEGDGSKTIEWRIRDDVWNQTTVQSAEIEVNTDVPNIEVTAGPSPAKISKVATKNLSTFTFKSDVDLIDWQVKVVLVEGEDHDGGQGFLEETNGSEKLNGGTLEAGKNQTAKLSGADLQTAMAADGEYIIKVFGQGENGLWSL